MRLGGKSDPRNKNLMKMFNLIDIGEHAGSGVPNIFNVWEDEGWEEPIIKESFDPDRTSLVLKFVEKQAIKTSDKKQAIKTSDKRQVIDASVEKQAIKISDKKQAIKNKRLKQTDKTLRNKEQIRTYLQVHEIAKTSDIVELLGVSASRARAILAEMKEVEALGANRTRIYRLRGR